MQGPHSPHHRVITPPAPALVSPGRVDRLRALFTSSSVHEEPAVPQRKRSVRFQAQDSHVQTDGAAVEVNDHKSPSKISDALETLVTKLNGVGIQQTVVHRPSSRPKSSPPHVENDSSFIDGGWNNGWAAASTNSSFAPPAHNAEWSPASTTSTPATSLTSPRSSGPFARRNSPEDYQKLSKSISGGMIEEGLLPPIQEHSSRFLPIRVQEEPVTTLPSIQTVENVAAAKIYLETCHKAFMEPHSPRSLRLHSLEQRMAELCFAHDERVYARREWNLIESSYLRELRVLKASAVARHQRKRVSTERYNIIRVLGKGSFGIVRLVTERDRTKTNLANGHAHHSNGLQGIRSTDGTAKHNLPTGKPIPNVFAMKVIRKSEMLRACQEGHLRAERDFLVNAEGSRWVVPLIESFQDNTNLYLVMEYMIGGDFLGLLLREDVLDEKDARWYVAEMILCVEEAHRLKWIHRDIKPDNFLISASGHLKISDFGLAFDGHWTHSQLYYSNQRQRLLDKLGIKVQGDEEDVIEDLEDDAVEKEYDAMVASSRLKINSNSEDASRGEGLLPWRNRVERRKLARSVVGTSQYMAPEVILGQQYDGRCD